VLNQNFPNPFKKNTRIRYSISQADVVSLKIYNYMGMEIQTLVNEFKTPGTYSIPFDAYSLDGGVYSYLLKVGNHVIETKQMIIIQ